MYTILIWMSDDVNGRELAKHLYIPGQEGYRQANYNYAWYNNPYFASYELQQMKDVNVSDLKARLNWQILPNLSLQGRAALHETKSYENMQSPKSYMNYGDSRNGDFKVWDTGTENIDADMMASYFQPISSKVNLSVNAGTAVYHNRYRQEYQSTDGLIVPQLYSLNNTMGPVMASNNFNQKQIRSVYGTANLDLFESVFLNVTARNDWSSTLPDTNNSYFYPSLSLSTMVSEYVWMPKAVDFLKLYGSWVQVSSDLSPYSIYSTYSKDVTYGSTQSVSYPSGIINPNIKPEMSISYEFGLSTSFLQNRLMLDMSYYRIIDENQIIDLNISEASGFSSRKVNGNQYTTDGLEVVIGAQPVNRKDFRWNLNANWSHAVKRLTEIYGGQKRYGDLKLGERADSYYGTIWQKSADGQLILDANNVLPTRDPFRANLGHTDPDWRLGLQNTFRIKDFVVGIDVDGAWGGVMRSLTTEKMWWGGRHPESVEYRAAEIAANAPVYVPNGVVVTGGELIRDVEGNVLSDTRTYTPNTQAVSWQTWCQIYPYQANVVYTDNKKFANIFDRTYFKLRRLSIGYDLANIIDLGRIKSCNLSLFGNNLLMWKNIPYVDPDYGDDNDLQDPSARYVGVSLSVKL
jgi:outer membrane receptor protein involved in Fe transport